MNPQLEDYIKKQKDRGVNELAIKRALSEVGWKSEDIDEAMRSVNLPPAGNSPAPSVPPMGTGPVAGQGFESKSEEPKKEEEEPISEGVIDARGESTTEADFNSFGASGSKTVPMNDIKPATPNTGSPSSFGPSSGSMSGVSANANSTPASSGLNPNIGGGVDTQSPSGISPTVRETNKPPQNQTPPQTGPKPSSVPASSVYSQAMNAGISGQNKDGLGTISPAEVSAPKEGGGHHVLAAILSLIVVAAVVFGILYFTGRLPF